MNRITLFHLNGCEHCADCIAAALDVNTSLPSDNQILFVDVTIDDSRLQTMADYYKTWDKEQWGVPLIRVDKIRYTQFMGAVMKRECPLVVIPDNLGKFYMYHFFKRLMEDEEDE